MKAVVIHGARDLRIEERGIRSVGPGEVRVRIARGGICGSDLHYYQHGGWGSVRVREPMILGHEVAGHVEALGDGVEGLSVGQLVAVSPSRPCGRCEFCQKGMQNHCENMAFYGSAIPYPHIQGAFREVLVASAAQCVPADGLGPAEAAMAEPLAVVLHALHNAGDLVGARILITGCGPIGLLAVLAARRAGAAEIIATDLTAFAVEKAGACGADHALNVAENPDALAGFQKGKGSIDIHLECSGSAEAVAAGLAALRPGGTLVQLGLAGEMALPVQALTVKELTMKGSFRFHAEFATAVAFMRKRLVDVAPLITHAFPLAEVQTAFETAADRSKALKTQVAFA